MLAVLTAYLLGSISFAWVASRIKGVDLREFGSGNLGATNAIRAFGGVVGGAVMAADIGKGLLAVTLIPRLFAISDPLWILAAGLAAVAGHIWSIFLRFRGGKGVASAAGVFLGLAPAGTGIALIVFLAVLFSTRVMSLASMAAAVTLPLALWWMGASRLLLAAGVLIALLVLVRHRTNLARLRAGTESRMSSRRAKEKS